MKVIARTAFCIAFAASFLALPAPSPGEAASKTRCEAYAKRQADRKMGAKARENAFLMGATGGIAGKPADGKRVFTGFGLGGGLIGVIVSNEKRAKIYKQYYARCVNKA